MQYNLLYLMIFYFIIKMDIEATVKRIVKYIWLDLCSFCIIVLQLQ